jgi:hypothetical protein
MGQWSSAMDMYRAYLERVPVAARAYAVETELNRLSTIVLQGAIPVFDDSDELTRRIPVFDARQ